MVELLRQGGRRGNARGIVDRWMTGAATEVPLHYPMTTEHAFDSPVYVSVLAAFYEGAAASLSAHLDAGRDVALLSEGDPLFYGSFMHLYDRLRARYPVTLVPGVTGMAGCWAAAGEPMTWGDDTLSVLPGTLPLAALVEKLRTTDAAVIMKLGRNFAKVRDAVDAAGLLSRAIYVERGTMADEVVMPLGRKDRRQGAVFLADSDPRPRAAAVTGSLFIVGLGPGPACWIAPEAMRSAECGERYRRLSALSRPHPRTRRPASSWQRQSGRTGPGAACLGDGGRRAAGRGRVRRRSRRVRYGGRGVRGDRDRRTILAQPRCHGHSRHLGDAGCRGAGSGAPLGHDFCAISLSDNLKPWSIVERRLRAAADGDFVIALFNPASKARPEQIHQAFELLRGLQVGEHAGRFCPRDRPG